MEVVLEDNSEGELDGESDVPDDDEKNQMVIDWIGVIVPRAYMCCTIDYVRIIAEIKSE